MKMVIELPADSALDAGTVLHMLGFPEPEIFGFLYVHPGQMASVGIFIPSWFRSPVRRFATCNTSFFILIYGST